MGSLSTPSSFSPFVPFVTLLAAAPPGRDGSTAGSFPFNDNRHKKQKEGILKIIKISYVVSEKAAQHDEFTRAPGGSSAAVYHTRDGKGLRIAGAGCFSPIDADAIPFFLPVISCGSPGPQKLDVQLERVIAAFDNRKLIPKSIMENFAAAFTKERVEICPTRWLAPFASSSTNPGGVAESETSLVLDSGASIHAVGWLLTGLELFSIDKWAVLKGRAQEGRSEHKHLDIILDSGASMHATGNLRLLSEFTRAPGGSSAAVYHTRDGKELRIAGVGMIACDKFHLPHVHYVPELGSRFTLASVQLLAGCDYLVMFCGGWCYVKNRNNGSLVGRGRMHDEDGLYHLEYLRIPLVLVDGAN